VKTSCAQNTSTGLLVHCREGERTRERENERHSKRETQTVRDEERTHRGMRVRYVKTLAKASSGMSLKAELSGRVMMTLESSPRPPEEKDYADHFLFDALNTGGTL